MNKVVLITGASSGIGQATAKKFLSEGWQVVATARDDAQVDDIMHQHPRLTALQMDVADLHSISSAFKEIKKMPRLDAVINNAGYGLFGPAEVITSNEVHAQFMTNTFGLMEVAKQCIPIMRKQGSGTIVNVSSMLGRITLPFFSMYASSKWAVEGYSEAIAFELEPYGIKVRLIEPGTIKTNFFKSEQKVSEERAGVYAERFKNVMTGIDEKGKKGAPAEMAADVIWKAVNSRSGRLRYTVDPTSKFLIALHQLLPLTLYRKVITKSVG